MAKVQPTIRERTAAVGEAIFGADPAGTVDPRQAFSAKTLADVPGPELGKITNKQFKLFARTARSAATTTKSKALRKTRTKALDNAIKRLAATLSGTSASKLNFGGRLSAIRESIIATAKAGATEGELVLVARDGLLASKAVPGGISTPAIEQLGAKQARLTELGAPLGRLKGVTARTSSTRLGRAAGSKFLKGSLPFLALAALELVGRQKESVTTQRDEIKRILDEASGPAEGDLTAELIANFGPEAFQQIAQDPGLALALQERLQSSIDRNLPRGVSVLRSTGAGAGGGQSDLESVLRQLGG